MKTKSFSLILSFLFIMLFSPLLLAGCNTYPDEIVYEISNNVQWDECVRLGFPNEMDMGKTWTGTSYKPTVTKYVLTADINCINHENENPTIRSYNKNLEDYSLSQEEVITNVSKTSNFILDGQNYKISNFSVYSKYYASVFGMVKNATVKNIVFEDISISGDYYVGGLFGYVENANIEIENVTINSSYDYLTSNIGAEESNSAVGGLIGYAKNSAIKIRNCRVQNTKIGDVGTKNVGGLVGQMYTSETNSLPAYSEVWFCDIKGDESVGGAIGYFEQDYLKPFVANFINLKNRGSVVTANSGYAGGIVGKITYSDGSDIRFIGCDNTLSTGKIKAKSGGNVGGILGGANWTGSALRVPEGDRFTFENCINFAEISAFGNNVGGVVGFLGSYLWEADFRGCQNNGYINSNNKQYVGGIVGFLSKMIIGSKYYYTFTGCENKASVAGNSYVAGILGYSETQYPIFKNCKNKSEENRIEAVKMVAGISCTPGTFENCSNEMTIRAGGKNAENTPIVAEYAGGIVAKGEDSTFKNCSNFGNILNYKTNSLTEINYVGGIAGDVNHSTFENCSNTGTIYGTNYVGGIVGHSFVISFVSCTNTGTIYANDYMGGISGWSANTGLNKIVIKDCSVSGTVYVLGQLEVGESEDYESDLIKGHAGAMFGRIDATINAYGQDIKNIDVTGDIYIVNYANYVGGIVGHGENLNVAILKCFLDETNNVNLDYDMYWCEKFANLVSVKPITGYRSFGEVDESVDLGTFNTPANIEISDYVYED